VSSGSSSSFKKSKLEVLHHILAAIAASGNAGKKGKWAAKKGAAKEPAVRQGQAWGKGGKGVAKKGGGKGAAKQKQAGLG
jgi:hypothetical protein